MTIIECAMSNLDDGTDLHVYPLAKGSTVSRGLPRRRSWSMRATTPCEMGRSAGGCAIPLQRLLRCRPG
jgi:hypothetical protein